MELKLNLDFDYHKIDKSTIKVMADDVWSFYKKHSEIIDDFVERYSDKSYLSITELVDDVKPAIEAVDALWQFRLKQLGFIEAVEKDGHGTMPNIIAPYNYEFEICFTYAHLKAPGYDFVFFGKNRAEILGAINLWTYLNEIKINFRVGDIFLSNSTLPPNCENGKIILFLGGIVRELYSNYSFIGIFKEIMGK